MLLAISCFYTNNCLFEGNGFTGSQTVNCLKAWHYIRNKPATEPVMLKVHNVKLSFDIWLILYMYFILYFWHIVNLKIQSVVVMDLLSYKPVQFLKDCCLIVVKKFSLEIEQFKGCSPFSNNIVIFLFLAVVPWLFTWMKQNKVWTFSFLIYCYVEMPFVI